MNRPYRPSNGSEGEAFIDFFCPRCRNFRYREAYGHPGCARDIEVLAWVYDIDDPRYPPEWVRGPDGPTCAAFEEAES